MKSAINRTFLGIAAFLTCLICVDTPASGYFDDYTPLSAKDRAKKFKLKTVVSKDLKKNAILPIAGAKMHLGQSESDDNIYIEGVDARGKEWKFQKRFAGLGTTFLTGDLDKNGEEDIILLQATGGCGLAPSYCLTVLTFDKNKTPFVFETFGYFNWDDLANDDVPKKSTCFADDFLDLDGDGRAEIVINELTSANGKTKSRSFWRTTILTCKNARWQMLKTYAGNKLPMVVRFTNKPNVSIIPQPPYNLTAFEDPSSMPESLWKTGRLTAFKKGDDDHPTQMSIDDKSIKAGGGNSGNYLFYDSDKKLEIISLELDRFYELLNACAREKKQIKYLPNTISGAFPVYLYISD